MGRTSSITMQSLVKIAQCAPAVGAKMWCLFFFVFFLSRSESGAPCVRGVHSSNTHCVALYRPISTRFGSFFRKLLHFQSRYIVLTFVARWRRNFCKMRSKIAKSQKIGGKVCAHHFVQIAEGFEKILLQQFRAETVDVHLYKFFSTRRYTALIASVKFRIGGPKTARNVQVVRTKSHTRSKFSKIFLEQLYTGWIAVVHLCFSFSLWRQMAPQQSAKFRTAFSVNFVPV